MKQLVGMVVVLGLSLAGLEASKVSLPYPGTYSGIVYDGDGEAECQIIITLSAGGGASAKTLSLGRTESYSLKYNSSSQQLTCSKGEDELNLWLTTTNLEGGRTVPVVVGTLSDSDGSYELRADRTKTTGVATNYVCVMTPPSDDEFVNSGQVDSLGNPLGYSVGTIKTTAKGAVTFAISFADGKTATRSTFVTEKGVVPVDVGFLNSSTSARWGEGFVAELTLGTNASARYGWARATRAGYRYVETQCGLSSAAVANLSLSGVASFSCNSPETGEALAGTGVVKKSTLSLQTGAKYTGKLLVATVSGGSVADATGSKKKTLVWKAVSLDQGNTFVGYVLNGANSSELNVSLQE